MDKAIAFRAFIILVAAIVLFALIALYRHQTCCGKNESFSTTFQPNHERYEDVDQEYADGEDADISQDAYGSYASPQDDAEAFKNSIVPTVMRCDSKSCVKVPLAPSTRGVAAGVVAAAEGAVEASEPLSNEQYRAVDFGNPAGNPNPFSSKRLSTEDLLPNDAANSKWAQVTPSGQGELSNLNFMTAAWHIGVNTQGQSLRNANLQLRSDPINPQFKVSPWMMSTIEPDVSRRAFEIM